MNDPQKHSGSIPSAESTFDEAGGAHPDASTAKLSTENSELDTVDSTPGTSCAEASLEALFVLNRMTDASPEELITFALERSVVLTQSELGFFVTFDDKDVIRSVWTLWNGQVKHWTKTAVRDANSSPLSATWLKAIESHGSVVMNDAGPLTIAAPEGGKGSIAVQRHISLPVFHPTGSVTVASVLNRPTRYEDKDIRRLDLLLTALGNLLDHKRIEEELRLARIHLQHEVEERTGELHRKERELEALLTNLPDLAWLKDVNSRYVYANRALTNTLGLPPGSLDGKTDFDAYPPDQAQNHVDGDRKVMDEGKTLLFDYPAQSFDNHIYHYETLKSPIFDENGTIVGSVGLARDVTARYEAQRSLQESEQRFRAVFDQSFQFTAILDPEGHILQINETAEELFALDSDALKGHSLFEMKWWNQFAPEDLEGKELIQRAKAGKTVRIELHRADGVSSPNSGGSLEAIDFSIKPVKDEQGEVILIVAEGRDITALKRAENELREMHDHLADLVAKRTAELEETNTLLRREIQEREQAENELREAQHRLDTVISNVPVFLFMLDADGIFTLSQGRGLKALGVKTGEQVGSSIFDVFPGDLGLLAQVREALAGRPGHTMLEDEHVAFEIWLQPVTSGDSDQVTGVSGVGMDVTRRVRLERQLLQAQKMEAIGQLAGGVAHDFNNLLTSITGNTDLASMFIPDDHVAQRHIREVHKAAERAANLTKQLLAFGRKQNVEARVISVNALLADTRNMLRRIIGEDIELETHLSPDLWPVKANPTHVEQIVVNLVVNARDAMPNGGRIVLVTENATLNEEAVDNDSKLVSGEYVRLEVKDTGCGMSEEVRARVFEPYFTTKEVGKGTGLGLATVYGIVKQLHGFLRVDSSPGSGTRLEVLLPRVSFEAATFAETINDEKAGQVLGGEETLLLVEDDEALRDMSIHYLTHLGYNVVAAAHGLEAIELCDRRSTPMDLVITDVIMPKMSGAELATELQKRWPGMRILYMSGYTANKLEQEGIDNGTITYLQKPFRPASLARTIRDLLDRPLN